MLKAKFGSKDKTPDEFGSLGSISPDGELAGFLLLEIESVPNLTKIQSHFFDDGVLGQYLTVNPGLVGIRFACSSHSRLVSSAGVSNAAGTTVSFNLLPAPSAAELQTVLSVIDPACCSGGRFSIPSGETNQKEKTMTQFKSTKPVHTIRYGNVRAAIWRNESGFHSVTFERSYRKDEEWKTSDSYGRDDLPKLRLVTEEAYAWIFGNPAEVGGDRE